MIFITVGAQMPFDRLIMTIDQWAKDHPGQHKFFAQIGNSEYQPKHLEWVKHLDSHEFKEKVKECTLMIGHAGMGTIFTALENDKPLLVMPRKGVLKETRNNHQVDTVHRLKELNAVHIASDEYDLVNQMEHLSDLQSCHSISPYASPDLINGLNAFIESNKKPVHSIDQFDGIICFGGEDWWYHNRGHFDMQMMREMSQFVPVLYVNSIGMRTPGLSEGRVFFKRINRKIKSFTRGLKKIKDNMWVYSPLTAPKSREYRLGLISLGYQIRKTAKKLNMQKPLVWVACPPAQEVLPFLVYHGLIYQRTDRFENFNGVKVDKIVQVDQALKNEAQLTLFCSRHLYEEEKQQCQNPVYVDHGVDYEMFDEASKAGRVPADVKNIPGQKIGFIGGIDAHTFDPKLFNEVVRSCHDLSFIMVGACSLPENWCPYPNVYFLGKKPYQQVADYMAACDVLIMPWNDNEWIEACNPIKLKEYLAVGKPIVTTPFKEIYHYYGLVSVAASATEFTTAIRNALENGVELASLKNRVKNETWAHKAETVLKHLKSLKFKYEM